jgi:predicted transposase YbfD/YdcC
LPADASLLNESIQCHWTIENNLHWNLDVIFRENNQAKRNQVAIGNANLIAKLANTMLEQEKTFLKSKNRKRIKAFADNTYRELILNL